MKTKKSWRRRYRRRNQITTKPLIADATKPQKNCAPYPWNPSCTRPTPGDRADSEPPGESSARRSYRPGPDRRDPRREVAPEVVAEIDHGPEQGSDVQRDVEGLVERRVLHDRPPEQPRDQDQMSTAGDGGELRDALGDPQDDRLQDRHARVLLVGRRAESIRRLVRFRVTGMEMV